MHGWCSENPGAIPAQRYSRSLTRLQSLPALSSSRPPRPGPTCSVAVSPPPVLGPVSRVPQACRRRIPARTPSARSRQSPLGREPRAASGAPGRVESSPRSLWSSPRQSHRRRHSAAPRCISGAAARVRPSGPRGRDLSVSAARPGRAGAGPGGGARGLGPPLAPLLRPGRGGARPGSEVTASPPGVRGSW